jgi:hypothetical protein
MVPGSPLLPPASPHAGTDRSQQAVRMLDTLDSPLRGVRVRRERPGFPVGGPPRPGFVERPSRSCPVTAVIDLHRHGEAARGDQHRLAPPLRDDLRGAVDSFSLVRLDEPPACPRDHSATIAAATTEPFDVRTPARSVRLRRAPGPLSWRCGDGCRGMVKPGNEKGLTPSRQAFFGHTLRALP